MRKRYTHMSRQREAADMFLRQSEILGHPQVLQRCESPMESTVIEAEMMLEAALGRTTQEKAV